MKQIPAELTTNMRHAKATRAAGNAAHSLAPSKGPTGAGGKGAGLIGFLTSVAGTPNVLDT